MVGTLLLASSLVGGWLLSTSISQPDYDKADQADIQQLTDQYFHQGVKQMVDKQYSLAADTWQKLLLVNESIPEAHANLGFSLIELQQFARGREHFMRALELNAFQANAYYGLAICLEQLNDIEGALGAMRSYVHLANDKEDPFLRKARSALWEWETILDQRRSADRAQQQDQATQSTEQNSATLSN